METASEVRAFGEPWVGVTDSDGSSNPSIAIVASNGDIIADVGGGPLPTRQRQAERICAAVNACAGIPTATLLATQTASQVAPLIAELVAAAEEAAHLLDDDFRSGEAEGLMIVRLRAAIAAMRKAGA